MKRLAIIQVYLLIAQQASATCQRFWNGNTYVPVGQGCFTQDSCPLEANGFIDPASPPYNADPTGAIDSSVAISHAIAAAAFAGRDIKFSTPGSYRVNLSGRRRGRYLRAYGIVPRANMKIECVAGVTLKRSATKGSDSAIFALLKNNNTICGCDFQGGQTGRGPFQIQADGLFLLFISGGSGATIEGNTFERVSGNSAMQLNNDFTGIGPSNVTIKYNTFSSLPYYAVSFDANITTATVSNNLSTDGIFGGEWDACGSGSIGTNLRITNNLTNVSVGNCATAGQPGCNQPGFSGNSFPRTCDYSGETITENYCEGDFSIHANIGNETGSHGDSHVNGNYLGAHCSCNPNSGCGYPAPTPSAH
jgi:Right handed beta helix region